MGDARARYRVIHNGVTVAQIEVDQPTTFYRTTMHYKLTNAKPQPVTVEPGPGRAGPRLVEPRLPRRQRERARRTGQLRPAQMGSPGARQWRQRR